MARLSALLFAVVLAAAAGIAHAQTDYPARPVKLVVPFAAGGPTDVVARILAEMLGARWGGQSIVIENRPGAGTIVATAAVANAPKDGYTFLIATNSLLINPAIGQKLPYDTLKDFAAVTMIATQPVALVANKSFAANTVPELVALAKKSAAPINYTSPGPRGVGHLAGELLQQRAGIKMQHINYNGSAPALIDLIAGRVPIMFDIWHSAKRYVDTGELKLIAGAGAERLSDAPNTPIDRGELSGLCGDGDECPVRTVGHAGAGGREGVGRRPRHRRVPRSSGTRQSILAYIHGGRRRSSSTPGRARKSRTGRRSPRRPTSR